MIRDLVIAAIMLIGIPALCVGVVVAETWRRGWGGGDG